jgi:membrane protein
MGVIGTLGLMLTAMGLFSALDRAFNRIWKTGVRRTFLQRFRAFWFILTLGPFLAGVSVWVTASLKAWAREPGQVPGFFGSIAVFCIPFVLTWCLFFVLYMYVPNTRVRPVSALLAAIVAGTVWEAAKRGFNLYVANAGSIDAIYGPLGILPLFMLWTYVTWSVILMGTELAYVDQNYRAILAGIVEGGAEKGAPREFHAIRLLLAIYRPFRRGESPPDLPRLCHEVEVRTEAARDILDALQEKDFVRRDRGGLYLPAREASRTRLSEVVSAVRGAVPAGEEALSSLFEEAESLRASFLGKTTLDDLLTSSRSG